MIIRTNNKEIPVHNIHSELMRQNGNSYPALRFVFGGGVTEAELDALCSGLLEIVDDDGNIVLLSEKLKPQNRNGTSWLRLWLRKRRRNRILHPLWKIWTMLRHLR